MENLPPLAQELLFFLPWGIAVIAAIRYFSLNKDKISHRSSSRRRRLQEIRGRKR